MIDIVRLLEHFGLEDNPFGKPKSGEVFRGKRYRTCINLLMRWIRAGEMGAIIGPPGSGKTTLINDLAAECGKTDDAVLIHVGHPGRREVSFNHVYDALRMEFADYGLRFSKSTQLRFGELREFLGDTLKEKRVGIVVDEAHRLKGEFMRGLKEFSEMSWALRTDLLGVIFVGWPQFKVTARSHAPDIYGRLMVGRKIIEAGEIMGEEMREYVRHRTKAMGSGRVFDETGLNAVSLMARTPLKANAVCLDSMEAAFKAGVKVVSAEHVTAGMENRDKKALLGGGCTLEKIGAAVGVSTTAAGDVVNGNYKGKPEVNEMIGELLNTAVGAGGFERVTKKQITEIRSASA